MNAEELDSTQIQAYPEAVHLPPRLLRKATDLVSQGMTWEEATDVVNEEMFGRDAVLANQKDRTRGAGRGVLAPADEPGP